MLIEQEAKVERTVHEVVLEVVRRKKVETTNVRNEDRLHANLGLGSLDLAEIVAKLETVLGVDPFAEDVAVTSIRSVGDLRQAYLDAVKKTWSDEDSDTSGTMLSPQRIPERKFDAAEARREARRRG